MTIEQLAAYGADTQTGMRRCLNNEGFYLRMVSLLPKDPNFPKLFEAMEAGNLSTAFEAAHALKGASGNLAITPLYQPLCQLTDLLRTQTKTDYAPLTETVRENYQQLQNIISSTT